MAGLGVRSLMAPTIELQDLAKDLSQIAYWYAWLSAAGRGVCLTS